MPEEFDLDCSRLLPDSAPPSDPRTVKHVEGNETDFGRGVGTHQVHQEHTDLPNGYPTGLEGSGHKVVNNQRCALDGPVTVSTGSR